MKFHNIAIATTIVLSTIPISGWVTPARAVSFTVIPDSVKYSLTPGQPGNSYPVIAQEVSEQTGNVNGSMRVSWTQSKEESELEDFLRVYRFLAGGDDSIINQSGAKSGFLTIGQAVELPSNTLAGDFLLNFSGQTSTGSYVKGFYGTNFNLNVQWQQLNVDPQIGATIYNVKGYNTWQITPVPEPLTILGSVAALGFGAYAERKRKPSESSEKDDTKDS